MIDNKQNLEGIVAKLKEQGIQAGQDEKVRLIADAQKQAEDIVSEARKEAEKIVAQANEAAAQAEKNAQAAMVQASRDVVEATKIAVIDQLKTSFGEKCESIFTQEQYLQEILKALVASISGEKEISLAGDKVKAMEAFLIKETIAEGITLKPLADSVAKIEVKSTDKAGIQFVLSDEDVKEGLFALLNKDLLDRISSKKED